MKKKLIIEWDESSTSYSYKPRNPEDGAPSLSEVLGVMEIVKLWMFNNKKTPEELK